MNAPQTGQAMPGSKKTGMKMGTKLALGCGGCFGLFALLMALGGLAALSTSKTAPAANSAPDPAVQKQKSDQAFEDFMMKRMDLILKRSRARSCHVTVAFNKIQEGEEINIDLSYDSRQSLVDVAVDTEAMVHAALEKLMEDGHQPAKEQISVLVGAGMPVTGATGTARFLPFGYASYDAYGDQVRFHPWDPVDSKYL